MSYIEYNKWNTTPLVINIMDRCARALELDINDDQVADRLYWVCCDLEDWPEDEGFGSSDATPYVDQAEKEFGLT